MPRKLAMMLVWCLVGGGGKVEDDDDGNTSKAVD
jgi:hypothetical protein